MILKLLELWTVSSGILVALWYILLSNTTGGVYLTVFSLLYLLMAWYMEIGTNEKLSKSNDRSIGLWCPLLLPLVSMLAYRQEDEFLPLSVAAVFVHYTWVKDRTSTTLKMISALLLLLQVISGLVELRVDVLLFTMVFSLVYGAILDGLPGSFTVGEGSIVAQLLTLFWFKVILAVIQQLQGQHIDILDKTTAVIYVCVSIATVLFICLKPGGQKETSFYIIYGFAGLVVILPAVIFLIKLDGIKLIFQLMFKNKKSIFLLFWWITCTWISIYIVVYYGKTSPKQSQLSSSSSKTFDIDKDKSGTNQNSETSQESSIMPASSVSMTTTLLSANQGRENTCTFRYSDSESTCDKEYFDINQSRGKDIGASSSTGELESSSAIQGSRKGFGASSTAGESESSSAVQRNRSGFMFVTTRVRKLFHLVMIVVYVPGLMCNTNMLYLASVVALAALVILEVIRLYKVPPLGPLLDEYFTVFLDRQDSGDLILTPLYLLIGCSLPLWFSHTNNGHADLKIYAGIVSIGVGDSAASLVGQLLGKHRWPGSRKTVEGTLGAVIFQLIVIIFLQIVGVPGSSLSILTVISVVLISCLEAFSRHIDNLVVSLFAFMLLSTTGTFI